MAAEGTVPVIEVGNAPLLRGGISAAVQRELHAQGAVQLTGSGSGIAAAATAAESLVRDGLAVVSSIATDTATAGGRGAAARLTICLKPAQGFAAHYAAAQAARAADDPEFIIVGGYTEKEGHVHGKAEGLYVLRRPRRGWGRGEAVVAHVCPKSECGINPSFVCLSRSRSCVYVTNEIGKDGVDGDPQTHGARAMRFDRATGALSLINTKPTYGAACCHVALDPSETYALFANYLGVSCAVAVYRIGDDGGLGPLTARICTQAHPERPLGGPGTRAHRQEAAHPHMACMHETRSGSTVLYLPDLGFDAVYVYALDPASGELRSLGVKAALALEPGDGPRHAAVHPDGSVLYVANELSSTCVVASIADDGALTAVSRHSTLPSGFEEAGNDKASACAAVHCGGPGGSMLLVSNRGHESVAVFATHSAAGGSAPGSGALRLARVVKVADARDLEGLQAGPDGWVVTPRDFRLLRGGSVLLAASQNAHFITSLVQPAGLAAAPGGGSFRGRPRRLTDKVLSPVCLCPV
eukprot:TRINITY_DN28244_c0_g1_i1.p1 TRINITY_DN28244_c0_g1~~TRINITY_DN28244_c0_g1_i1.p1  ORF type:complete len:553 (+),score=131.58 TRINITY_DN28244_c0_g1_i1:83-1660(+)